MVGSPRKDGNTEIACSHTLKAIEEEGLDTELIRLANLEIKPCTDCAVCKKKELCSIDDDFWPIYNKMKEADVILFASPVYFSSATANLKALMDRAGYIAIWNDRVFEGKVGVLLVVGEREGHNFTFAQLIYWLFYMGCFIPGSTGWNIAFGLDKGDLKKDKQGLETMWNFGKNAAFLTKKLCS
jgi:multimeric flavodoxin WrbA